MATIMFAALVADAYMAIGVLAFMATRALITFWWTLGVGGWGK